MLKKRYKCKKCGVVSVHKKPCFYCGCKDKEIVQLPSKRKRGRFGNFILRIGL